MENTDKNIMNNDVWSLKLAMTSSHLNVQETLIKTQLYNDDLGEITRQELHDKLAKIKQEQSIIAQKNEFYSRLEPRYNI